MSAQELITEHLDIWTSATTHAANGRGKNSKVELTGIQKLRELILELAVRGKLVTQDSSDDPARRLLNEIAQERASLVEQAEIRKPKRIKHNPDVDKPSFTIPSNWEWSDLDSLAPIPLFDGDWIESKDQDPNGSVRLIQLADIGIGKFNNTSRKYINRDTFLRLNCSELKAGDILIARLPSPIGRAAIFPQLAERCITAVDVAVLRTQNFVNDSYLVYAMNSKTSRKQVESFGKGATRFRIATGNLKTIQIPFPPLKEQHRIVQKVDELMALCDRLEQQTNDQLEAHETLVDTLLNTLTQSESASELADNWARLAAHFDTLFTTEQSIDKLKQAILKLAVMGRLVEQNTEEEPASTLLNRLSADRETWLQENASTNRECQTMRNKLRKLSSPALPYPLPTGWEAAHLIQLSTMLVDCHNKTAPYVEEGIPIIRTSNIRERQFVFDDLKYVDQETYAYWSRRCPPEPQDIIFTREAPMGEAAIIPEGKTWCLGQRTMLIRPMHEYINNRYLLLTLTEPNLLERASEKAIGSTVKHLRVGDVEKLTVPVPPLAEQHRIVQRVDDLMTLCDRLKQRLNQSSETRCQLAETVAEGALQV